MTRAETLEQLALLCRTGRDPAAPLAIESSKHADLDAALGGGWPVGTIVELMPVTTGIGELRLLMPTLAHLTRTERYVALISPPHIPFAPALAQCDVQLERLLIIQAQESEDALWAFEQTLRCKSFGAVVAWPSVPKDRQIRRLQLAAEAGRSIGFLYRPPSAALESSPAAVRLKLQRDEEGLIVDILKCRGRRSGLSVTVNPTVPASTGFPVGHGSRLAEGTLHSDYPLTANR